MNCIILLSGSFNPVHIGHIKALRAARARLEKQGYVIGSAVLAPSSDAYVGLKLGVDALPLQERIALCEKIIADDDDDNAWIRVCHYGIASPQETISRLRQQEAIPVHVKIFEVAGADFAAIAKPWLDNNRPFVCVGRKGSTNHVVKQIHNKKKIRNNDFYMIDDEVDDTSSTTIRQKKSKEK